ncbi:MAG: hypothetical protein RBS34_16685, partial [Desulfofustis sp.]|nr:hypothetical protein [Desulfofustis sp.]
MDTTGTMHAPLRELGLTVRILSRNPSAVAGGVIIGAMIAVALCADLLAPYDPISINLAERLRPPSTGHLFGTDEMGRDIFS